MVIMEINPLQTLPNQRGYTIGTAGSIACLTLILVVIVTNYLIIVKELNYVVQKIYKTVQGYLNAFP